MSELRILIPERRIPSKRLGRHVRHDPRSRVYEIAARPVVRRDVWHARGVPIYDQGEIGSCTGNALAGCLSSEPFGLRLTEADAVSIYSDATRIDNMAGAYPPDDTGSSGLAVCKVAKNRGLISAYGHAYSSSAVITALQHSPGILGMAWRTDCDTPSTKGIISYTGAVRGGHEVELVGYTIYDTHTIVWCANSWGPNWGLNGYFGMTTRALDLILGNYGDAIFPAPKG